MGLQRYRRGNLLQRKQLQSSHYYLVELVSYASFKWLLWHWRQTEHTTWRHGRARSHKFNLQQRKTATSKCGGRTIRICRRINAARTDEGSLYGRCVRDHQAFIGFHINWTLFIGNFVVGIFPTKRMIVPHNSQRVHILMVHEVSGDNQAIKRTTDVPDSKTMAVETEAQIPSLNVSPRP